ncbi:cytochrome c oxidase subunit II [Roseofilum reptotaenium CS-1145]|uniref:Cytochrome c oxidase subunit 2 n=1 Tax=Roseofilum reptotaenium AO1-A TaxID=1925591 RepID=A0A1L9QTY4_9CYAN|nr:MULTISPECIES: cytochrome c oxidase subunit II [Roseofilum]MBP0029777.1 cytochrome c oxidase subunit II [Roseofilum sp. Guam]MDB9518379.1 cytochrome c oxidase subunit II [Roseofilum reptotaenium CS-1145]OJJ26128.1 cytochrome C oxidase subunit II [Roseofilum reptotaenium AO1-A]
MNIPSNIITLIAGILLTLISLWFGQHHGLMPVAASEEAPWIDGLFNTMMTISIGLFLLVQGILIFSIVRFRQRPGDETDGPPIEGNIPLEIVWTAIPAMIVLGLGVYSFDVYTNMGGLDPMASHDHGQQVAHIEGAAIAAPLSQEAPTLEKANRRVAIGIGADPKEVGKAPDLVVDVLGLQYAWIFTYPETGIVSGDLHMPVDRDVQLNIKAADVIHSLWIPQFRVKQDAIPGRETELRLRPRELGTYPVVCAELCGSYHGGMRTQTIVESAEDFDQWVNEQIASVDGDNLGTPVANLSSEEYLVPYTQEMGIDENALKAMGTMGHEHHHAL